MKTQNIINFKVDVNVIFRTSTAITPREGESVFVKNNNYRVLKVAHKPESLQTDVYLIKI